MTAFCPKSRQFQAKSSKTIDYWLCLAVTASATASGVMPNSL